MEEEQQGLSICEIFKVIFKRIWWVVAVTAAVTIIAVLFMQLIYNRNKVAYNVSYELAYPGSGSNLYPDGTDFRLHDIVSFSTLEQIKSSDEEKFGSIDIESMAADDDISIAKVPASNGEGEYLKITVVAKYFKNKTQAVDFIRALVDNPVNKINDMVQTAEYGSNLSAFDNADTYEQKIAYLDEQKRYLLGMYDALIGGNNEYLYYVVNDNSLNDYRLRVEKAYTEQDKQAISSDLQVNQYVFAAEKYKIWAESRIAALEKEREENETRITALVEARAELLGGENSSSSINTVESFNAEIIKLVNANSNIDIEIEKINNALDYINRAEKPEQDAFDAKLAAVRANLAKEIETLKTVRSAFYEEKSQVYYKSNKIVASGGINILLAAVIGAIAGFAIVAIVICIIDLPKYKREKYGIAAQTAADAAPVAKEDGKGNAPAQTAAQAVEAPEAPEKNDTQIQD